MSIALCLKRPLQFKPLRAGKYVSLSAKVDGKVIAGVDAHSSDDDPHTAVLNFLNVLKADRLKGNCSALYKQFERTLPKTVKRVVINSVDSARDVLLKNGF